jgi:hypothetical protein
MSLADYDLRDPSAPPQSQGCGCSSRFLLPPLVVLFVGTGLATIAFYSSASGNAVDLIARDSLPGNSAAQTAASASSTLSPIFTAEVQSWSLSITRWAAESGLDPNLVAVVMQIESCGDPSAVSRSGAIGLFQVMPFHFLATDDPYLPDVNAARGLGYLKRSLTAARDDARLALAGYNGGIGVISQPESTWPAETVRYARWGGDIYADAVSGSAESSSLADWFSTAGAALCSRARTELGLAQ